MYNLLLLLLVAGVICSPFALEYWLRFVEGRDSRQARRRFNQAARTRIRSAAASA